MILSSGNVKESRRVFLIAPPRFGTTILLDCLRKHSKVECYDESNKNFPTSPEVESHIDNGMFVAQKFPSDVFSFKGLYKRFPYAKYIIVTRDLESIKQSYSDFIRNRDINGIGVRGVGIDPEKIHKKFMCMIKEYSNSSNCLFVRNEKIKEDGNRLIKIIFNFLGLEYEDTVKDFVSRNVKDNPPFNIEGNAKSFANGRVDPKHRSYR